MNITEQALAKLQTNEDLHQFLHDVINNLTQKTSKNFDPDLHQLATCLKQFYTEKVLDQTTHLAQTIPSDISTAVESVFRTRHTDLVCHVVRQKVAQSGRSVVENFDWRLKWILGSSTVAELREPVCQIDLICDHLGPDLLLCKSVLSFECDLNEIDQLISALEGL